LRDFIPQPCARQAAERMFHAAMDQGFELTSKAMREQYAAATLRGISGDMALRGFIVPVEPEA
jgi:hypothetical protein